MNYLRVLCAVSLSLLCWRPVAEAQYVLNDFGRLELDGATDWDGVDENAVQVAAFDSSWRDDEPTRYDILWYAIWEDAEGLCGADARHAYGADAGDAWCSEYARTIFRRAGGTADLRDVTGVSDLVDIFADRGGWTNSSHMWPSDVQPGDYIALTTHDIKKNHSAVVLAISSDERYIWTSEGNVSDCVRFMRRDFYVDGWLNPDINGVGRAAVLF